MSVPVDCWMELIQELLCWPGSKASTNKSLIFQLYLCCYEELKYETWTKKKIPKRQQFVISWSLRECKKFYFVLNCYFKGKKKFPVVKNSLCFYKSKCACSISSESKDFGTRQRFFWWTISIYLTNNIALFQSHIGQKDIWGFFLAIKSLPSTWKHPFHLRTGN